MQNTLPLVSMLIPVYNVESYLPCCLDSVIAQTYPNLQIVLIDDGSKDASWEICTHYSQKDNRVEAYHQTNEGVATTRNRLLSKVKGSYVLFIDSDDWIETDMVESLLSYALQEDADIVECKNVLNDSICDKSNKSFIIWNREQAVFHFLRHVEFRGTLWNKLFRFSILSKAEFHSGISYGEDALFCWDVLQKANSVFITNQQYYHYRINETSLSSASFGPKKFSAYECWRSICTETEQYWPQCLDIAKARFCIEMILLIRSAIQSNYPYCEPIIKLQDVINQNLKFIKKTKLSSLKLYLFGIIASTSYQALKVLFNIFKIQ